ncbi:helix-turn-helix domain-containing protein [Camelimonas abortus]|uniref:Helix-turn-helix domain-containing protein n=1 Tax=Camelimonas abortus TaxID=1017184 RepID=A0ABV7LC63_9HYPH
MSKARNPIDQYVGSRVRMRRMLAGISQEKLGEALGVTFQQIQKYEKGANRIGASRLHQIAQVLGVPVSFFYDGMTAAPQTGEGFAEGVTSDNVSQFLATAEGLHLNRCFVRISDARIRRKIVALVETIANAQPQTGAPAHGQERF